MKRERPLQLIVALTLCSALMGCAHNSQSGAAPPRPVQLVVHNSNTRDVNLYVVSGAARARIGTARSMATSQLTIPAVYLASSAGLVLQADPIGSAVSFTFPAIRARSSDRVEIQVGNVLQMSSFAVYAR